MMNAPLQIALLITELGVGGAEKCLCQLALDLADEGAAVQVYSLAPRPAPPHDALVERLTAAGIPLHFAGARSIAALPGVVVKLRRLLARQRPLVLQSFLYHANVVAALVQGGVRPAPQLVAGIRVAEPRTRRLHMERLALRRAAAVVCVSQSLARYVEARQGVASEKLHVIPNAVDPDTYRAAQPAELSRHGIADERRVLLVIARLDPQKGLDWLIHCIAPVLEQLPQHHLVIAGEGPQRAELAALIASGSLTGRVHLLGFRRDIPALLARSEMLLLPSRWEGMPNVILEAMAAGRPVLAAAVEGVEELLGSAGALQMFPSHDVDTFRERLRQLAADAPLREQLGEANRQRASTAYSPASMSAAYRQLYEELLARRNK